MSFIINLVLELFLFDVKYRRMLSFYKWKTDNLVGISIKGS